MTDQGQDVNSGVEPFVLLSLSVPKSFVASSNTASSSDAHSYVPESCSNVPNIDCEQVKIRHDPESVSLPDGEQDSSNAINTDKEKRNIEDIVIHAKTTGSVAGTCKDNIERRNKKLDLEQNKRNRNKKACPEVLSVIMGNHQSGKSPQSDDDTPDEGKTKCCEIPKKKVRDRNSKISRSSKTDENDYTEEEVYPFETHSRSEHELNEPVELEPFEIIETDEIKFVAGAGTSEVIRIASEAKFKSIPEEDSFDVEQEQDEEDDIDQTEVKQPISFNDSDRLLESGTTTAHSTFEFKQIKAKNKLTKPQNEHPSTAYDNVTPSLEEIDECFSEEMTIKSEATPRSSTGETISLPKSTKSGSSSSEQSDGSKKNSKEGSRKNSKEAIAKPARKSKTRKQSENDKVIVVIGDKLEETGENTITVPARTQERSSDDTERNPDNVIILTQTMFSKPKKHDKDTKQSVTNVTNSDDLTKYENVNLGVKFEPTVGISVGHKDPPKPVNLDSYENVNICAKFSPDIGISIGHSEQVKSPNDVTKGDNIFNAIEGASPHHMTLAERAQLVKEQFLQDEKAIQESKKHVVPVFLQPTNDSSGRRTDGLSSENQGMPKNDDVGDDNTLSISKDVFSESVPPPSPTAMDTLLEEEEEEEEEEEDEDEDEVDDDVLDEEERRKSAEIVEFTEHVCKRLSQLLDVMTQSEDSGDSDANRGVNDDTSHVYENTRNLQPTTKAEKDIKRGYESSETILADECDNSKEHEVPMYRELEAYERKVKQGRERCDVFGESSDDSLPEYYDNKPLPKRDSEILCDVLDAYTEDVTEVSAQEVELITESNQLNFDIDNFRIRKQSAEKCHRINPTSSDKPKETIKGGVFVIGARDLRTSGDERPNDEDKNTTGQIQTVNIPNEQLHQCGDKQGSLQLWDPQMCLSGGTPSSSKADELYDTTPTSETLPHAEYMALMQGVKFEEEVPIQFDNCGRRSVTYTESDLDISEHRDDLSTDSMLADDEDEETMDILFTKTYTEPVQGSEVFLSCTVVNSAYKEPPPKPKSETWLSDEALEYLEANAADVMSTAFMKARKEMKDIQICIQSLRQQMEHFHGDCDDISLPDIAVDSLSPDYFGLPRKAVTD